MNRLKRVFIIGHFEGASNNRTDLELKSLISLGVNCEKINLLPYIKSRSKYILRLFKSFSYLFKISSTDVVIIYGESPFFVIDTFFIRLAGGRIIFERTEYSNEVLYGKKEDKKKKGLFDFLKNLKYADGFITCSDALIQYYRQFVPSEIEILKLSLLVDSGKFHYQGESPYNFKYIAYCGYMGDNKDGVPILIEAFKKIQADYKEINLLLIGTASEREMISLKEQVKGIEERVIFTGAVAHDAMPKLLSSASILALARPDNKQAEGGFPSKLGEYLSTGKPVIVTKVGEIPSYIQDGVNGYLVEPDDADLFANKLKYILDNYDEALIVGKEGLKLAKYFDYLNQGLMLKNYTMKI